MIKGKQWELGDIKRPGSIGRAVVTVGGRGESVGAVGQRLWGESLGIGKGMREGRSGN